MSNTQASRRSMIAALVAAPIFAFPASAADGGRAQSGDSDMNMHAQISEDAFTASQRIDAKFWSARSRWKAIEDEWEAAISANSQMDDVQFSAWGCKCREAFDDMLAIDTTTLLAMYAKLDAIKESPDTYWRETDFSRFDIVLFNVERLAKRQWLLEEEIF